MEKTMLKNDAITLSKELLNIVAKFLSYYQILFFSYHIHPGEIQRVIKLDVKGRNHKKFYYYAVAKKKLAERTFYLFHIDGRFFEIHFYKSPDDFGYANPVPNYAEESAIFCKILEKRPSGKIKNAMEFGFDIEKIEFLELFDLIHYSDISCSIRTPEHETMQEVEKALHSYSLKQ